MPIALLDLLSLQSNASQPLRTLFLAFLLTGTRANSQTLTCRAVPEPAACLQSQVIL